MDSHFRLLFEENYNKLCRIAYRLLLEEESAREIVQEVFIKLWQQDNWQQVDSPKAYLYVAVYNRSLNELKKRKRFVSESALQWEPAPAHASLEYQELENAIVQGIDALPEQCKKIFLLSREEEMTYAQIADHLGLSVKTIERQIGIALKKLREQLHPYLSE